MSRVRDSVPGLPSHAEGSDASQDKEAPVSVVCAARRTDGSEFAIASDTQTTCDASNAYWHGAAKFATCGGAWTVDRAPLAVGWCGGVPLPQILADRLLQRYIECSPGLENAPASLEHTQALLWDLLEEERRKDGALLKDSQLLIASARGIFGVGQNGACVPAHVSADGRWEYQAIGCGGAHALAAMWLAASDVNAQARGMVALGVEAAMRFDIFCGGDVVVWSGSGEPLAIERQLR